MPIVDENGDLFGLVNVVDIVVVLLLVLVTASAVAVTLNPDDDGGEKQFTQVVKARALDVDPATAERLSPGPVADDHVLELLSVDRYPTDDEEVTLLLELRLLVDVRDGVYFYNGSRLTVGQTIPVGFGEESFNVTILELREPEVASSIQTVTPGSSTVETPTPTPTPTDSPTSTRESSPVETVVTTEQPETRRLTLNTSLSPEAAERLNLSRLSSRDVLRVVSVTNDSDSVVLTLEVAVETEGEQVYFRGIGLRTGQSIRFVVDGRVFYATVVEVE